CHEYTSPPFTF
nr:immunoglobulin light chain junction region [Macaca mulatta]